MLKDTQALGSSMKHRLTLDEMFIRVLTPAEMSTLKDRVARYVQMIELLKQLKALTWALDGTDGPGVGLDDDSIEWHWQEAAKSIGYLLCGNEDLAFRRELARTEKRDNDYSGRSKARTGKTGGEA